MLRFASPAVALALAWVVYAPCSAQVEAPAWARVARSVVVVGYTKPDGTFAEWGTGFCITSTGSSSQFLTDAHVVAQPSSPEPLQFVVLFPNSQTAAPATIVRSNANVDLAIVSVTVGNVPVMRISPAMPEATQRIALGGYPYVEGRFGGLLGSAQQLGQAPDLSPSVHLGDVSDVHGTFIEFDGTVDHGNSGGPLFDPVSGVVYGVIEGYVPGAPVDPNGTQVVSSAYANLATSRQVVADFLNGGTSSRNNASGVVQTSAGGAAQPFAVAAARGDAESENTLGLMYRDGTDGVQRDYAQAVHYFHLAADQGNADGEANLAVAYLFGHGVSADAAQALRYFQLSAAQGNGSAEAGLGFMEELGDGVPPDAAQALRHYERSAHLGDSYGQAGLGFLYEIGDGVTRNYLTALHYFQLSAAQGNSYGENDAGTLYEYGLGVTKSYATALRDFQLSAQQGNSYGESNLATMFTFGWGVPQDYTIALRYYTLSASDENPYGEAGLGYLYENGKGVAVDYAQALQDFQRSAARGNSFGEFGLGYAYATGHGVSQDLAAAVRYYRLSAAKSNPFAEAALGYMYENGYGVPRDDAQALQWYELSVSHGYDAASSSVQRLEAHGSPPPSDPPDPPDLSRVSQLVRVGNLYEDVTQHFTGTLEPSWTTLEVNGKTVVFADLRASAPIDGYFYDVLFFDGNGAWLGSQLSPARPTVDSKNGFLDVRYSADGGPPQALCCKGDYADLVISVSSGRAEVEARGYGPYLNASSAGGGASIIGTSAGVANADILATGLAHVDHLVFDQTGGLWASDLHEIIFVNADDRRVAARHMFAPPCSILDVAGTTNEAAVLLSCGRVVIVSRGGSVRGAGSVPAGTRFVVASGDRIRAVSQNAGVVRVEDVLEGGPARTIAQRIPWRIGWAGATGDELLLYDATSERLYALGRDAMAPVCGSAPVSAASVGGYGDSVAVAAKGHLEIVGTASCVSLGAFPALHPAAFALSNTLLVIAFADSNIVFTAASPP